MKRILALLIVLAMVSLPALGEGEWYFSVASDMTEEMVALAREDAYISMYTSTSNEAIDAFAAAELDQPVAIWRIDLPGDDEMRRIIEESNGGSLSDTAYEAVRASFSGMFFSVLNNAQGSDAMVAGTLLGRMQTERLPEDFSEQIWLIGYEDALVGVSFIQTGDDSVSAYASPLIGWTNADAPQIPAALAPFAGELISVEIDAGVAVETEPQFIEADSREEIAREMAEMVIQLAGDADLLALMGYTGDAQYLTALASAGEKTNEWHYHMATKAGTKLLMGALSEVKLSDEALEALVQKFAMSGCTIVNAQVGTAALTESSLVTVKRSIRIPEDFKDSLIVLQYGQALVSVSFVQTGADTATVTATPIFSDGTKNAETLANDAALASLMAQVEE